MDKVDILIPVMEGGSKHDNLELKFALRSIEKYVRGYNEIHIVGSLPSFIDSKTVKFYPYGDYSWSATNIYRKIAHVCDVNKISSKFLFTNDDIFFLDEVSAPHYPYYYDGTLTRLYNGLPSKSTYRENIMNTIKIMYSNRPRNFDVHRPIVYDRLVFMNILKQHDWAKKYGYLIKTCYCEDAGITAIKCKDLKIRKALSKLALDGVLKTKPIFSIADEAIDTNFVNAMNVKFPNKSKYER